MTNIICDENHKYWIDDGSINVPGVSEILQATCVSDFSMVPERLLATSIQYGKAVHSLTHFYDTKTLNMEVLDPQLLPVLDQWKKFLKDYNVKLVRKWIERVSFCPKWRYGFTPDRLIIVKGKYILLDIKTGVKSKATKIQTAAYRLGIEEVEGIKISERWVIYLGADKYNIDPLDRNKEGIYDRLIFEKHRSVFLSCLNVFNFKKGD